MRFTDGLWMHRAGVSIHNARQLWEYKITDGKIHAFVLCHFVTEPDSLISGTALEITFSAPYPDVIRVDSIHNKGSQKKEPKFQLKQEDTGAQIEDLEDRIVMTNGKMKLIIRKGMEFSFDFYYEDRYLTGSQNGSMAYIADVDYMGDQQDNVNHRTPARRDFMKTAYLRERLNLGIGENIYGLGEHFTPLIRNGQTLDVWNRDGSSNCDQAYKSIPLYLSSFGYGILVDTPDYIRFEFGTESVRHVQFSVEDEKLSYLVIGGENLKQVLGCYTAMAGRTPVPPAWTFGLWLSTSWIPNSTRETALAAIDEMKARGIPLSVYHFDARWMNDFHDCNFVWSERFGDAKQMIADIHDRGVKVCVWINPYVSQISRLFQEGMDNGYFLKNKDGSIWQTDMWMCGMAIVDFTNPAASKWYTDRLGEILDMGVDCIKTDFGERIPTDVVYYDGSDARKMHNYYTFLYNQAIYQLLERKKGKEEAVVFARSATVGTQQFPINWGGDNQASYISMSESLRGGLSFCQSGYGYWCHDISGFEETATPDLYKHWVAFGMLCTHSRLHGHNSLRMPWCFDEESCDVLAHFTRLKLRLLPYIYGEAVKVHTEGIPEMRALVLEFPDDPTCAYIDRQFMLGSNIMVAPIFNEKGTVTFYVPNCGTWTDIQTEEKYEGGKWYTRTYDYFGLPILVRANAVIPVGKCDDTTEYDYLDGTRIEIFEPESGKETGFTVCERYHTEGTEVWVKREADQIIIKVNGRLDNARLVLHGISRISGAENASVAAEEENCIVLSVAAGAETIRISVA